MVFSNSILAFERKPDERNQPEVGYALIGKVRN